jgi:hypothetical protein
VTLTLNRRQLNNKIVLIEFASMTRAPPRVFRTILAKSRLLIALTFWHGCATPPWVRSRLNTPNPFRDRSALGEAIWEFGLFDLRRFTGRSAVAWHASARTSVARNKDRPRSLQRQRFARDLHQCDNVSHLSSMVPRDDIANCAQIRPVATQSAPKSTARIVAVDGRSAVSDQYRASHRSFRIKHQPRRNCYSPRRNSSKS